MKRWRFDRKMTILLVFLLAVCMADTWYALDTWQLRADLQRYADDSSEEKRNLVRLQSIRQLSAARQELAGLQVKAPASFKQPLPSTADTLKILSDLLNTPPPPGKLVSFKAKEPKTETVDDTVVQVLGYELGVQGNSQEMLALLSRVDDSSLVSLRIPSLSLESQEGGWLMKTELTLSLLSTAQPTPTPASKTR